MALNVKIIIRFSNRKQCDVKDTEAEENHRELKGNQISAVGCVFVWQRLLAGSEDF